MRQLTRPPPILSVIIGLLGLSPYAQAQSGLPQAGERLRYWMRPCHGMSPASPFCGTHSEGILLSFVPDSVHPDSIRLMLRREALGLSVPVRDMVRLERRSGRRSAFWTGAGYGAWIGGISGVGVGLTLIKPEVCTDPVRHSCRKPVQGVIGGLTGALGGALLGGILGAVLGRDRWQPVRLEAMQLNSAPSSRGAVLILTCHAF
jgi:hypothetical protein